MPYVLALLFQPMLQAAAHPVQWDSAAVEQPGGAVRVELRSKVEEGWHIYATSLPSDEGPIATSIRFGPSDAYTLDGALIEPEPVEVFDPHFGLVVRYHAGSPVFAQRIVPSASGPFDLQAEVEYMVCNDVTCLPPVTVRLQLRIGKE